VLSIAVLFSSSLLSIIEAPSRYCETTREAQSEQQVLAGAQGAAQTGVGCLAGCSMNFQEDSDEEKKVSKVKAAQAL
jgi:hypothetical protein